MDGALVQQLFDPGSAGERCEHHKPSKAWANRPACTDCKRPFSNVEAAQCGFARPGNDPGRFHLLRKNPDLRSEDIREGLAGNPLPCTDTLNFRAVAVAARPRGRFMRADPANFELIAPGSCQSVVTLLASEPGRWAPDRRGYDVMVRFAAGMLSPAKLVSVWNLPEVAAPGSHAGGGAHRPGAPTPICAEHPVWPRNSPLLANAAARPAESPTQNRGTLGGNIVKCPPAAIRCPLCWYNEADLILVSVRRRATTPVLGVSSWLQDNQACAG